MLVEMRSSCLAVLSKLSRVGHTIGVFMVVVHCRGVEICLGRCSCVCRIEFLHIRMSSVIALLIGVVEAFGASFVK